ncbi:ribosomal protein S18-alanine N-acetyltransferase [Anoxynatronum buryatiense]|uniref:[SSU ribosomal protein S18P]-alanine acetyltransferase n=1 Tax=Anoxynatronum buryatiense TaxID=489973 RepID=A0AA45WY28_9CLOT|nr:ribosomal protein S18-alanine N-acetyltransferase [Anoxynatronum buryatiense]SMP67263.1 [SSU ribosomal protein S18P]-alanine acetyltransferase [Anoxynatronum buryatiense]
MKTDQGEIRAMTAADIPGVIDIEKASFTTPWTHHAFRLELKNQLAVYRVAVVAGKIAAYGGMWLIIDEAHVTNVAVHPGHRGQHWGENIMHVLMADACSRGLLRMTLEVRKSNDPAIALYRKLGFRMSGIRPGYYQDTGEDALIMWAELDQRISCKETL